MIQASLGAESYYAQIDPASSSLQADLAALVSNHTILTYTPGVWDAFPQVYGNILGCGDQLGDVYSSKCWNIGSESSGGEQCGNYRNEGDCYNREHVWPVSWWGGSSNVAARTDIFHIWPSDGWVNQRRGNLPFCNIEQPYSYISSNGNMGGRCAGQTYNGWEVVDEYKGELARAILYVSTAYMDQFDCCTNDAVDGSKIQPAMEAVLRRWHANDPPSSLERAMNDIVFFDVQGNRNPFIDHPEWVELILDF